MIPDTATTCRSRTISSARDNFMFGSGMFSKSIPAAADARRAVAAGSFLCLKSCGFFIGVFEGAHAPARVIGHLVRHIFYTCRWRMLSVQLGTRLLACGRHGLILLS